MFDQIISIPFGFISLRHNVVILSNKSKLLAVFRWCSLMSTKSRLSIFFNIYARHILRGMILYSTCIKEKQFMYENVMELRKTCFTSGKDN